MRNTLVIMIAAFVGFSCSNQKNKDSEKSDNIENVTESDFNYKVEKFADLEILRYKVEGFDGLSLQEKKMVYYLSEAALQGRDILFDQNNRYNLAIRRTLEAIYANYKGDKNTDDYKQFEVYLKRIWFSNGIHHHYGEEKFLPEFSEAFFKEAVLSINASLIPTRKGQTVNAFIAEITPVMFDPKISPKKVNQDSSQDVILTSANNYYEEGITQKEVEDFYGKMKNQKDPTPISYGLNSRLVKKNGKLVEEVWKVNGLYSQPIEKIIYWLEKAKEVAENEQQKRTIELLIGYYKTGNLKKFDEYSFEWVKDTQSKIDFVNGFIETYGDPLGLKASWESIVNFKDEQATKRSEIIEQNAQWFEDNSPVDPRFKKEEVKGVSAKVIVAAILAGDCYPATPIGINLPNSNWIRKDYGSKSVTISNITDAYDKAAKGNGFNEEFVYRSYEKELINKYGAITNNMHIDLHECLGHGSGQLLPGVDSDALGVYGSTIEEARADLFGLYYLGDVQMLKLNLLSNKDAYKAEYYKFMMNGLLTQLARIELGKNIEESHMRNRALIARWVLEKGKADQVAELVKENSKTYVVINDYEKLRELFGELLSKIQKIRSEGNYKDAKELVEKYAVKVNPAIHEEILTRYKNLEIAPYKGFVNPVYEAIKDENGNITDVKVTYSEDYSDQMMRYSKDYSSLPTYN